MNESLLLLLSAILVNNFVLAQFLGICPFLGVSSRIKTALGMGGAVFFVMILATSATHLIYHYALVPYDLMYLRTIAFILIIASLVQVVEIVLHKVSKPLYDALGVFLPLITTNCAILGLTILAIDNEYSLVKSIVYAIGAGVGFTLALLLMAGMRERLVMADIPRCLKGTPIALIIAGLLAVAFLGFAGLG